MPLTEVWRDISNENGPVRRLLTTFSNRIRLFLEGCVQAMMFATKTFALNAQKSSGSPLKMGIKSLRCFTKSISSCHWSIVYEAIRISALRLCNESKRTVSEHENTRVSWKNQLTTIDLFRMKITNVMLNVLRLNGLRLTQSICD